jgi:hypothetical protein
MRQRSLSYSSIGVALALLGRVALWMLARAIEAGLQWAVDWVPPYRRAASRGSGRRGMLNRTCESSRVQDGRRSAVAGRSANSMARRPSYQALRATGGGACVGVLAPQAQLQKSCLVRKKRVDIIAECRAFDSGRRECFSFKCALSASVSRKRIVFD